MTKTLTIIAQLQAKAGKVDFVKDELLKLIAPTRMEKGCIQYDLHQDNNNPELFVFVESWQNQQLWQEHMNSAHLKAYVEATKGAVTSFSLNEMSQIA